VIDLNGGYLNSTLQPEAPLAAALARPDEAGVWSRPPMHGLPELRSWFARHIVGAAGRSPRQHRDHRVARAHWHRLAR